MRWLLAALEAFTEWRASRLQKASGRWIRWARALRARQERGRQGNLFGEGDGW